MFDYSYDLNTIYEDPTKLNCFSYSYKFWICLWKDNWFPSS